MPQPQSRISDYDIEIPEQELEEEFLLLDALRRAKERAKSEVKTREAVYDAKSREVTLKAQALARRKASLSTADEWKDRFRKLWLSIPRAQTDRRTSLAVVHGLVERADAGALGSAEAWLEEVYGDLLSGCVVRAHELERDAVKLGCGLPVLDFERTPISADALFGVVEEVEDGEARVLMSIPEGETDPTAPIWEACTVPAVDLPVAYALPGVWVAWVDRTYDCDGAPVQKGRFEPASSLVTVKPPPSLLVEASRFSWTT